MGDQEAQIFNIAQMNILWEHDYVELAQTRPIDVIGSLLEP